MIDKWNGENSVVIRHEQFDYEPKCSCGSKVWEAVEVCEFEHSIECSNKNCEEGDDFCTPVPAFKCVECGCIEEDK